MKKELHKRYLKLSMLISFSIFALIFFAIYIIDPVGLNNRFDLGLVKEPSFANRTQKFIEINKLKPNTIMLGGSRVYVLNTKDIEKYTNDKVYNLGFFNSTLEEQYYFLKYSVENFDIRNVVMGLNLYPFSENALDLNKDTDFDKEIFANGFTFTKQLKHYLEVPITKYFEDYYTRQYKEALCKDGSRTAYDQVLHLESKTWEERKAISITEYNKIYKNYLEWGSKGLEVFRKIVELCKENNINLYVYTTAIHESQLQVIADLNKMDIYYEWKKELAKITSYWDFMYVNSFTTNSDNYVDTSHTRQEKGYLYFAKLFGDKSINVPEDFGVFVTKENVDQHIINLKKINPK